MSKEATVTAGAVNEIFSAEAKKNVDQNLKNPPLYHDFCPIIIAGFYLL